jgi:hypothetical protein
MRILRRQLVLVLAALAAAGCGRRAFEGIERPTGAGQLGHARRAVLDDSVRPIDAPLREATLAILTLDDGLPERAEVPMQRVYETLRTRGLNARKQAAAAVINEEVKTWKGEPYEQAVLYLYVALQQAAVGEWGNARAASDSALDLLDDFDAARGVVREVGPTSNGYVVSRSDLALAHLISAVANRELGRADEAADHLDRVVQVRPQLADLAGRMTPGSTPYDTVLVVEMGAGPVLERGGADGTEEVLVTRWPGDERELVVTDDRGEVGRFPRVLEVNGFADEYRWEGLAGLRRGKSNFGTLMAGGGAVLLAGDDEGARWAGLGLLLGGLLSKAGAHADVRSLSVLPERFYFVPVNSADLRGPIGLRIGSGPGEAMVIPPLPPADGTRMIVVRVPAGGLGHPDGPAGEVLYGNDAWDGPVPGDDLPWILGGRSVAAPTPEALARYQAAGNLLGLTTADLRELYRAEGIVLPEDERPGVPPGAHVLEGGRSLATPRAGTLGFVRLFCREHEPYRPGSDLVRKLMEEMRSGKELQR